MRMSKGVTGVASVSRRCRERREAGYLLLSKLCRMLVGVIEYGPAFKTAHLSCEPAASGSDIINETLVGTAGF